MIAKARTLTADALDAHITFNDPASVEPAILRVELENQTLRAELPAKSVTLVKIKP